MSQSRKLAQLVTLQEMREQRSLDAAAKAKKAAEKSAHHLAVKRSRLKEAGERLDDAMSGEAFCPDILHLNSLHLLEAQAEEQAGRRAAERDHAAETEARQSLAQHQRTTEFLVDLHATTRRGEERRKDDARQAEQMSLRHANQKGRKP